MADTTLTVQSAALAHASTVPILTIVGPVWMDFIGIIRDISINGPNITYKCEITTGDEAWADVTLGVRNCAVTHATSVLSLINIDAATVLSVNSAAFAFAASSPAVAAGADTQLYAELDAVGVFGETNTINPHWAGTNASIVSAADAGGGSTYVGLIIRSGAAGQAHVQSSHVADVVDGTTYDFSFKYKYLGGDYFGSVRFYQMVGSAQTQIAVASLTSDEWATLATSFVAIETGPLMMRVAFHFKDGEDAEIRIDQISIKAA